MNLKKIISGLIAGVIAVSFAVSAMAEDVIKWSGSSNGTVVATKTSDTSDTGELITPIKTDTVMEFDLKLVGAGDHPSYLQLQDGNGDEVLTIKKAGWNGSSYDVGADTAFTPILEYTSNKKEPVSGSDGSTVYPRHFKIEFIFGADKNTYTVTATKLASDTTTTTNENLVITREFTATEIKYLKINAGKTSTKNTAALTNLTITTTPVTPAGPVVTEAIPYNDYTIVDGTNTDAKGFTADITPEDDTVVSKLNWYLKDVNGRNEWKKLDVTGVLPETQVGDGSVIKVGLVVYNFNSQSTDGLKAGYTCE